MNHPLVERLLELCPHASTAWQEHLAFWQGEPDRGVYNDLAVFAHHVVETSIHGDKEPAAAVLAFLEQALETPSEEDQQLLIWGLVESIQVIASHTPGLQEQLTAQSGPRTADAWQRVAEAWAGHRSLADVLRHEARQANPDHGAA